MFLGSTVTTTILFNLSRTLFWPDFKLRIRGSTTTLRKHQRLQQHQQQQRIKTKIFQQLLTQFWPTSKNNNDYNSSNNNINNNNEKTNISAITDPISTNIKTTTMKTTNPILTMNLFAKYDWTVILCPLIKHKRAKYWPVFNRWSLFNMHCCPWCVVCGVRCKKCNWALVGRATKDIVKEVYQRGGQQYNTMEYN